MIFNVISLFLLVPKIGSNKSSWMKKYSWYVEVPSVWSGLLINSYEHFSTNPISLWSIVSSLDQYHKFRYQYIFPKSKCGILGQFSSYKFLPIFNIFSILSCNGFWFSRKIKFPQPIFPTVDKKHHCLSSKYDYNNDH